MIKTLTHIRDGFWKPQSTSDAYEIARGIIEREFEEASHDFKGVMESMGWKKQPAEIMRTAQHIMGVEFAFTREDVQGLVDIIEKQLKEGKGIEDIYYDSKVNDYKVNLIAEYMQKALKRAKKVV